MTGIFRIASDLVAQAVTEAQTLQATPPDTPDPGTPANPPTPTVLPQWLRPVGAAICRAAARFGSSAPWTACLSRSPAQDRPDPEATLRIRDERHAIGFNFLEQLEQGGNFQPYWEEIIRTGAEVDVLGGLEESVNEPEVLLSSLGILERWGGAGAGSHQEILDYQSRLTQAVAEDSGQGSVELTDEILRWFPSYLQNLAPYEDSFRNFPGPRFPHHINTASEFLANQNPEEISTRDVATLSMLIALEPHFQANPETGTARRELLTGLTGDGYTDLRGASQTYRDALRHYLTRSLEISYGREALLDGLPPQNAQSELAGMSLPNFVQRPVALAFTRFAEGQAENLHQLFGDFGHLEATISTVQGLNMIWDAQDLIGQYDPSRIGLLDDWFLDDSEISHLRNFSEEAQSRAGHMDEGLGHLRNASSPEERVLALNRFQEHRNWWQERWGTDPVFFNQLRDQVDDISLMNEGRDGMGSLMETTALTLATLGTASLASLAGRIGRTARALEAGTTGIESAATLGSRALSTLRETALFEGVSLAWDSQVDPGRRVSLESSTGEDLARNGLRFFQTLGLFGTMNAVHRPFQGALQGIENLLVSTPTLRGNLGLRAREGLLRIGESAAEVFGNAAYQTLFDSTFGQLRGLWGGPTFSFEESLANYFNPQNLAMTLPLTGINNFIGWIGRRFTRRQAPPVPVVPEESSDSTPTRQGFPDATAWMRESLGPNQRIRINNEEWVNLLRLEDDYLIYRVVGRDEQGRGVQTELPAEITSELLGDNFLQLPPLEIRPTENGLSPYRLQSAQDYLSEPILVSPQLDPVTGRWVYYAVDGHHRLFSAFQSGQDSIRARLTDTDPAALEIRMLGREGFPIPPSIDLLQIDPSRLDGFEGDMGLPAQRRRALIDAGLNPGNLSEAQLGDVYHWLQLNGVRSRLLTDDERHWLGSEVPSGWDGKTLRGLLAR